MFCYFSFIDQMQNLVESVPLDVPEEVCTNDIIDRLKIYMFDHGVSSSDPFIMWFYNGEEIKSILTNSDDFLSYEEERITPQERIDIVVNQNYDIETYVDED